MLTWILILKHVLIVSYNHNYRTIMTHIVPFIDQNQDQVLDVLLKKGIDTILKMEIGHTYQISSIVRLYEYSSSFFLRVASITS